jgi:hypothetical protein
VWGIQELFEKYRQTRYELNDDGTIYTDDIEEPGKSDYIDAMMSE